MKRNHLHLNALLSINQVLDLETEQDPVGAPGLGEPFCLASMTFPELLIQEGKTMQRPGRSSKETIVQPRGRVLVPPQGLLITRPLSPFTELKTQQMGLPQWHSG